MTTTHRLAASIIDLAGVVRDLADGLPADTGVGGAEAVLHLRDAQRELSRAHDALRLIVSQQGDAGRAKP